MEALPFFDTFLLIVIVAQGCIEVYHGWKIERHYNKYFSEREAWRLAQRKSRKKLEPEGILNKEEGQQ